MRLAVLLAAVFALGLFGCSSKDEKSSDGDNTSEKSATNAAFKGTWKLDMDEIAKVDPEFKEMPPALRDAIKMEVTIDDKNINMKTPMMGEETFESQAYTLKNSEGNKYILEVTTEDGEKEDVILEVMGERLTMENDEEKLVLKR